jgi:hypothetical protein
MPEKKMWVHWEDGAELSQSRKKPGARSPLTRDGDNNLGHVTLRDVDEDEEDWHAVQDSEERASGLTEEELLGALFLVGVVIAAAEKAAPHIRRWWNERAVPFLQKSRNKPSVDPGARDNISVAEQSASPESSQEVIAALDEYRASMSSDEARERFVAALVARLFSDEQLRVLRNARIEDEGPALELARAMETLTPQQLGEGLRLMLEANPSWADEEMLAEIGKIVGRRSQVDRECVPAKSGQIDGALRLPRRRE